VQFKSFIVSKIDKVKNTDIFEKNDFCSIDVNSWFKSNNLSPSCMNEIRQYIFEEWLSKKIEGSKNKVITGYNLVVVYEHPTSPFIDLLKEKINNIFECEFCEVVLLEV